MAHACIVQSNVFYTVQRKKAQLVAGKADANPATMTRMYNKTLTSSYPNGIVLQRKTPRCVMMATKRWLASSTLICQNPDFMSMIVKNSASLIVSRAACTEKCSSTANRVTWHVRQLNVCTSLSFRLWTVSYLQIAAEQQMARM